MRKLLAEALVLSAIGAVLGVLFSAVALPVLLQLAPDTIPRLDRVRVDGTVLIFTAAAAIVSALIFGLAPAIRYTRPNILACLRHGGRSATDHPGRQRGRHLLVIAQTAMALVLLVGSGLLARSFARLMQSDQGFVAENVLDLPGRTARADVSQGRRGRARHQSAGRSPRRTAIGGARRRDHRPADERAVPREPRSSSTAVPPRRAACRRSSTIRR